ncbi:stalk domain-containing protein [Paenibacillus sp. FJAT-26967]|uniref:stalk domain-containing protein n=1 Tax=Paenibacillus sp. FJAT-26967 TaxID=1729690 RepID=UPI000838184E|nr:stalk domain-containing protein [Paenibacillus sp. FJAT-26967]
MRFTSKLWRTTLAFVVAFQVVASTPLPTFAAEPSVTLKSENILTSGAVMKRYVWKFTRNNKQVTANANVIEVDLTSPYVKLDVMSGKTTTLTDKQTVITMAKESGAVAGVNGDFFNTQAEGVPLGPQITNGQIITSPVNNMKGLYAFGVTKDNKPVIDLFAFQGTIKASNGAAFDLGGINKTYYWFDDGTHSHKDGLFMYTEAWGQVERSNDGQSTPTEVLVQDGVIKQIAVNSVIKQVPPANGYILRAAGKSAEFVKTNLKVGEKLTSNYAFTNQRTGAVYPNDTFKMMIGGHSILVDGGKATTFSRDVSSLGGYRSRTGVGYSKDMKTAYVVTADKNDNSAGMSLQEFQKFLIAIGADKAMNLDGGGSTQMVERPLGTTNIQLANQTEYGSQRIVVNGLGVFSTAPKGQVKSLVVKGDTELFLNEKSSYTFSAYDTYYNPMASNGIQPQWQVTNGLGKFEGNSFIPTKFGSGKLTASSGEGSSSLDVKVIRRADLSSMKVTKSGGPGLVAGGSYNLTVSATTKSGKTKQLSPASLEWEVLGIKGAVKDGVLHVESLEGAKNAQVIARYDGFSSMVSIPIGNESMWYNLDDKSVLTNTDKYPAEVEAKASIVKNEAGNNSLQLAYDFTKGKGNKAAYAVFNTNGAQLYGYPQAINLRVKGDESENWLRAEIIDANGKKELVELAKNINWQGWKSVSANLSGLNLKYPLTIRSIYVVNPEQGQDERALQGKIELDDISFSYPDYGTAGSMSKVKLQIGSKTATVDGKSYVLEQAPINDAGNTLVPIRFVSEALGAKVLWNQEELRATVVKNSNIVDMWNNQLDLIADGKRVTAEVPPRIVNNLTMVPLRIITENLGWKVTWNQQEQSVTLQ